MAAALFVDALSRRSTGSAANEWRVSSAGTWATEGLPASPFAVEVLAEKGIDLSAHRSHGLGQGDLEAADVVLVMTGSHRDAVVAEFSDAASKVFMISQMTDRIFDISDPYGGPKAEYIACAEDLQGLIESGFERITVQARAGARGRGVV